MTKLRRYFIRDGTRAFLREETFSYLYPRDRLYQFRELLTVSNISLIIHLYFILYCTFNDSSTDRYRNLAKRVFSTTIVSRLRAASLNLALANAQCTRSSYLLSAIDRSSSTRGLARTGCRHRSLNSRSSY